MTDTRYATDAYLGSCDARVRSTLEVGAVHAKTESKGRPNNRMRIRLG